MKSKKYSEKIAQVLVSEKTTHRKKYFTEEKVFCYFIQLKKQLCCER